MKHVGRSLTVLVACVAWAAVAQVAGPPTLASNGGGALRDAQGKSRGRPPTYGGGPVQSANAVKYDASTLKAHNVPDITTDNKR
jgi:hypothetical protein